MAETSAETSSNGSLPGPSEPVALVDSSAIVALVDANDKTHTAASDAYRELVESGYKLFVTNYTVSETVDLLAAGLGAEIARHWLRDHRLPIYQANSRGCSMLSRS